MKDITSKLKGKILFWPLVLVFLYAVVLFRPLIFFGKLPIPADTIVGLYHPWRDYFAEQYPSGIPFKNFLITDPVRQQYPWRKLVVENLKNNTMPSWNPYNFSGTPLLANLQSSVFFPLNFLFWLTDFATAWSIQIVLQVILAGLFFYWYLAHLKLRPEAIGLGLLAWLGSGFVVSWLEWNTIIQVALWLPLILLAIDKVFVPARKWLWGVIFILSLTCSFFAGHLQVFFYLFLTANLYLLFRLIQTRKTSHLFVFTILYVVFFILITPQLLPTLTFIHESARNLDQASWNGPGWFLPWQNLIQLVAPDYFGHPATLNYFGIFSYQEFVSYVGIVPLIFALFSVVRIKERQVGFYIALALAAMIFALPTPLAKLPFLWQVPLISTASPTRLIFLVDFSLAVLAAFGFDYFLKKSKGTVVAVTATIITLFLLVMFVFSGLTNQSVSLHNLYLPMALALVSVLLLFLFQKLVHFQNWCVAGLLLLTLFDVSRFVTKFESFSDGGYLFPQTKVLNFLQNQSKKELFRIAAMDDRITPPNFLSVYHLQSISGYDPLYLARYGQLVATMESGSIRTSGQLGFNRIVVPKNYSNSLFDLLNVKYLLALSEISSAKYKLVLQEGQTRVYENQNVLPRAFFVSKITGITSINDGLEKMLSKNFRPGTEAVVENLNLVCTYELKSPGEVMVKNYQDSRVTLETTSVNDGFLILTDSFYPGWQATIDGQKTTIFPTDVAFRGIMVPAGKHTVIFQYPEVL